MNNSNPLISIVCVSLNNPAYIDLLLRGLQKNTINSFEVLVHGNMAGEAFNAVIEKYKSLISVYNKSKDNLFEAAPANKLFEKAKGKYFVFLDDDAYPSPGWDQVLLKKVQLNMLYQYLSPVIFNSFGEYPYGNTPETFREDAFNQTWKKRRTVLKDTSQPIGNWFIKRGLWEMVGGFDPRFDKGEDCIFMTDIYNMAMQKHQLVEYRTVADCSIYHFGHVGMSKEGSARVHPAPRKPHIELIWNTILKLQLKD